MSYYNMDKAGSYIFCDHCEQSVSERTLCRHMALEQSRQLKRSFIKDSSTSLSDAEGESDCKSSNLKDECLLVLLLDCLKSHVYILL